MKKVLYLIVACALLCACGTKTIEQQCPYTEDSFYIHISVLQNVDSMNYYDSLANLGDARALYIMGASYHCHGLLTEKTDAKWVKTRREADSLEELSARQGYKPAIAALECLRECGGETNVQK